MNKLKHVDVLISDNKKKNIRYLTAIYNNKRCKFEFGTNDGIEFMKSLNITSFNVKYKFVSKYRMSDINIKKINLNYHNFMVNGIVLKVF